MIRIYILLSSISILCFSCSPVYYMPTNQNVPMITDKGDLNVNMAVSILGDQLSLASSYGLTNNLAVMLNTSASSTLFAKENGSSVYLLEGGLGAYYNINPWLMIDLYPLVGIGSVENHFKDPDIPFTSIDGKLTASFFRYGVQPSINFHYDIFALSFSAGYYQLRYNNIKGDLEYNSVDQVSFLEERRNNTFIEPAATLTLSFGSVRLKLQALKSYNLSRNDLKARDFVFSGGFGFMFKKEKKVKDETMKL